MGRKKTKKAIEEKPIKPNTIYKIILLCNGKQKEYINWYRNANDAMKAFQDMLKQSNKVLVPMKYSNITEIDKETKKRKTYIGEVNYDLIIVKKKEGDESLIVQMKNEYGEYTDHTTTSKNWILYEKEPYNIEETFWVYGYHPLRQRKNCQFIFDNLIKNIASKSNMLNIKLYRNKLLIESCDNLEFITCKNKSTGIALYNALEALCEAQKVKHVLFSGDWSRGSRGQLCEEEIMELTHWNKKKVQRTSTRP